MIASFWRIYSIVRKEFLRILRTPTAMVFLVAVPAFQVILFGYAINANPKNIPTAVIDLDNSYFSRGLIEAMKNTEYFSIKYMNPSLEEAKKLMASGKVLFVLHINSDYSSELIRGRRPQVLLEADFTNYVTVNSAVSAMNQLMNSLYTRDFSGNLNYLKSTLPSIDLKVHRLYNPAINSVYSVVPGLIGVILFLSLAVLTSDSITMEIEEGTYETILNSPLKNVEIMVGKIMPFVLLGYIQLCCILIISWMLFSLPLRGSLILLFLASLPFILSSLGYGLLCSVVAKTKILAQQLVILLYMPSILLSGFIFPFEGMPKFAQIIGELLPLTYYIRICRGIIIKGYDWHLVLMDVWPIVIFWLVVTVMTVLLYKKTLD